MKKRDIITCSNRFDDKIQKSNVHRENKSTTLNINLLLNSTYFDLRTLSKRGFSFMGIKGTSYVHVYWYLISAHKKLELKCVSKDKAIYCRR